MALRCWPACTSLPYLGLNPYPLPRQFSLTDPLDSLRAALEGRYAVERLIGEGGMATVYLAHDSIIDGVRRCHD